MKRIISAILLIIIAAAAFTGCGIFTPSAPQRFSVVWYDLFDTGISVTAYCRDQKEFNALSSEIYSELQRYHRLFDIYNEYEGMNNACTVNKRAGDRSLVETDPALVELAVLAAEMYRLTDGRVNVALGPVLSLWHEAREVSLQSPDKAYIPSAGELSAAAQHCSIEGLFIDREKNALRLEEGMSLDLGAVAKGFAVEKTAQKLESEGRSMVLISAGGNVRAVGSKPEGEKWSVAIQNPDLTSEKTYVDVILAQDISVVTSGVYQRCFEYNGRSYHHIIDPDTLMPEDRFLSVTIAAKDSGAADALSTAVFNMDQAEGLAFIESLQDTEALWILPDGSFAESSGWEALRK